MLARLLAVSALAAAVTAAATRPAPAQPGPTKTRAELASAFNALMRGTTSNSKTFGIGADREGAEAAKNYGNVIRLWATLYERRQDAWRPDGYVSLTKYRWPAEQRFKLVFQSPIQVYFYLFNEEQGGLEQVLPHEDFPKSTEPIPAKKEYELPIRLFIDPKKADTIQLWFVPEGNIKDLSETLKAKPDPGKQNNQIKVFSTFVANRGLKTFGVAADRDKDRTGVSNDPDAVADYVAVPQVDGDRRPQPIIVRYVLQSR
jgi:hypothetical protein